MKETLMKNIPAKAILATAAIMAAPYAPCFALANNTGAANPYIAQLRTAAEGGNAEAQYNLGNAYYVGIGVQKNNTEAVKWFSSAANQGNAKAESSLGTMYQQGAGVQKDDYEAVKWYEKAVESGSANAHDLLGFACLLGDGLRINYIRSYRLFPLPPTNGNKHPPPPRDSITKHRSEEHTSLQSPL